MKCICPSGGNRECPDDCFIAVWHTLPDDQKTKARRQPIVGALAKQGYTQEAIALQLGVSHQTVGRDLATLSIVDNVKGQGKDTRGRKKSTGRPKGSGTNRPKGSATRRSAPAPDVGQQMAQAYLAKDSKKTLEEIADEFGATSVQHVKIEVAREEGRREPKADRADLSLTAQQKYDAAIKQAKLKLETEIRQQMQAEFQKRLADVLVDYREKEKHYNIVIARRKGFMKRAMFARFRFALHPDTYKSVDAAERNELVAALEAIKIIMLDEKEAPATGRDLPKTLEEWEKRKAAYQAERAAQRAAKKHGGKSSVSVR